MIVRGDLCEKIGFLLKIIFFIFVEVIHVGKTFPNGSDGKESAWNVGDLGLIPGLGRSPGEGNGNPLQYSCLENPMDRGAWRLQVAKSQRGLSDYHSLIHEDRLRSHMLLQSML